MSDNCVKFVMWGYGIRGKRLYNRIGKRHVCAVIDNDKMKQGKIDDEIPVISFERYLQQYKNHIVIITMLKYKSAVQVLEQMGIYQYLLLDKCPYELYSDLQDDIFNYFVCDINEGDAIYGLSLYSILLQERIQKERKINIPIIPLNILCLERLKALLKILGNNKYEKNVDKYINKRKKVFVVTDVDYDYLCEEYQEQKDLIINAYDFSYKIPYYYNPQLEKFKDIHKNQRIFIVCTGPSLRIEDLEKLEVEHEVCMSMNNIFRVFDKVAWRPNYYFVTDVSCLKYMKKEIITMDVESKFISDLDASFYDDGIPDNVYKFHSKLEDRNKIKRTFSEDIPIWVSSSFDSITYICIQFAVYMGSKEIILIGCDNSFNDANSKKKESHFIENYYEGLPQDVKCYVNKEGILNAFRCAKEYADSHRIKIYNATRGGELEVFERIDFDNIINRR